MTAIEKFVSKSLEDWLNILSFNLRGGEGTKKATEKHFL